MCAVNPIMGLINTGMSNGLEAMAAKEGLMIPLCALLAGMMAIDMGGPFNKAAYVFANRNACNGNRICIYDYGGCYDRYGSSYCNSAQQLIFQKTSGIQRKRKMLRSTM